MASPPAEPDARPLIQHIETVRPEWVDYNGHMNVAFYVLVFDHATDAVLDCLDLGEAYRERSGCSVFVAEMHVTYEREIGAGDEVRVHSRVQGFDGKRLILLHEMRLGADEAIVASNEVLCLHVDLGTRRTAAIPGPTAERIRGLAAAEACRPRPTRAGRAIGLAGRRPQ